MILSCHWYQTKQLPTVPPFLFLSFFVRPVQQQTPPVIGARITDTLIVGP